MISLYDVSIFSQISDFEIISLYIQISQTTASVRSIGCLSVDGNLPSTLLFIRNRLCYLIVSVPFNVLVVLLTTRT